MIRFIKFSPVVVAVLLLHTACASKSLAAKDVKDKAGAAKEKVAIKKAGRDAINPDGTLKDFTVKPVGKGKPFKLSEARGKFVALHFLLKTECPICLRFTRDYARNAKSLPDVQHVFLKPDEEEETIKWFSKYPENDPNRPTIHRDPEARLAKRFGIPDGYKFHGEVVHYPALVLIDSQGKEVFRYVGKSTFDRFTFSKLKKKMTELKKKS